ncbi:hypothetical protein EXS65_04860 [Candidatus Peribacteria bacterium]|nr:hypothetical protein [Candidatus Peribacteria bacterium]
MDALLLTDDEQKFFGSLPAALKEEWEVQTQIPMSEETPSQLVLRYKMAHFDDPRLQKIMKGLRGDMSRDSVANALRSVNIGTLSMEQLAELFFILGIGVMSRMITVLLQCATTDDDLEGVAGLTRIRSALHEANVSQSQA